MATHSCADCGKAVAYSATKCPQCGSREHWRPGSDDLDLERVGGVYAFFIAAAALVVTMVVVAIPVALIGELFFGMNGGEADRITLLLGFIVFGLVLLLKW